MIRILKKKKYNFNKKNIILLTAHPDDEIMFFYPTIKNIIKENNIHLICLSNGNYERIGNIREKELYCLCKNIGINYLTINNFEDNIKKFWDTNKIESFINSYIKENNIDTIITFDDKGISYHPNHISCYFGIQNIKDIDIFILESLYLYRKYLSIFDIINIEDNEIIFYNFNIFEVYYYMIHHLSQMKWYRFFFILLSRYSYYNTLKKL
jgi:N-acetylglucosaminylphosphatidylinositol deacetylase